jgi:4'-phosphopantetheinyl transferase EntD
MTLPNGLIHALAPVEPDGARFLTEAERVSLGSRPIGQFAASGCARNLARKLAQTSIPSSWDISRDSHGVPRWPEHLIGSLAHTDCHAAACLGTRKRFAGVGIDVERQQSLGADTSQMISSPEEQALFPASDGPLQLFAIKEAVFKACFPKDRQFLEFKQVKIGAGRAITNYGREVHYVVRSGHLVLAIAWF